MHLTFVRHGETVENRNGTVQGHLNGTLTERGLAQARAVAARLASEAFDQAWSSDLARCADTAGAIVSQHPSLQLRLSPALREYAHGAFEGRASAECDWATTNSGLESRSPGGESALEIAGRLTNFLNGVLVDSPSGRILAVTHGGAVRIVRALIEGCPLGVIWQEPPIENTGVLRCEITHPLRVSDLRW